MKHLIQILFISLIIVSCNQNSKKVVKQIETETVIDNKDEVKLISDTDILDKKKNIATELSTNSLKIQFTDFQIIIDSLEVWDNKGKLKEIQKDTAIIYLELGASIESKKIRFSQSKFNKIEVYQRFENSITISDEGAHCDLINWKHYYSNWELLKIENGGFTTKEYSEKDTEKFIKVSVSELKKYVEENCVDKFVKNIRNIKNATEYPSGVSTSRIFLKIRLEETKTGEKQEKILSFEIPMGC